MSEVLVVRDEGVLWLTLNRPEALNALTNACLDLLTEQIHQAATDPQTLVVVLQGQGPKAFCSGIDLAEREPMSAEDKGHQSRRVVDLVRAIHCSPTPVVASIGGWCLGAGLELALACDVRVAADAARFGFPEMKLGAYPGGGGAVLLQRVVGPAQAIEWLLSGRHLTSVEALAMGLLSRVTPSADLAAVTTETAKVIASRAPLAVAALKESMRITAGLPIAEALEADQTLRRPLDATLDYAEGLRAHREKRAAVFIGA
jgi:enoyl-CoA hydratase/carnithine racemase